MDKQTKKIAEIHKNKFETTIQSVEDKDRFSSNWTKNPKYYKNKSNHRHNNRTTTLIKKVVSQYNK